MNAHFGTILIGLCTLRDVNTRAKHVAENSPRTDENKRFTRRKMRGHAKALKAKKHVARLKRKPPRKREKNTQNVHVFCIPASELERPEPKENQVTGLSAPLECKGCSRTRADGQSQAGPSTRRSLRKRPSACNFTPYIVKEAAGLQEPSRQRTRSQRPGSKRLAGATITIVGGEGWGDVNQNLCPERQHRAVFGAPEARGLLISAFLAGACLRHLQHLQPSTMRMQTATKKPFCQLLGIQQRSFCGVLLLLR